MGLQKNGNVKPRFEEKKIETQKYFCCLDSPGARAQQTNEREDEQTGVLCIFLFLGRPLNFW